MEMDPSRFLAELSGTPPSIPSVENLASEARPVSAISFQSSPPAAILVNSKDWGLANGLKAQNKTKPRYDRVKALANPYESLSKSPFLNRAAMKLAGIDGVLGVSGTYSLVTEFFPGRFTFCDIAGGPGSWSQYLHFRRPDSVGFGITLKGPLDWAAEILSYSEQSDRSRPVFIPYYGSDNSGDLYKNAPGFGQFVQKQTSGGVDLAVADGGFDVNDDPTQEQESTRLILSEAYTSLLVLAPKGNLVLKMYQTATLASAGIIYLLSTCFQSLMILKPLTSRANTPERYLIGIGLHEDISIQKEILEQAYNNYSGFLHSLVEVPKNFQERLEKINNQLLEMEIRASARIAKLLKGDQISRPQLRLDRVRAAWGISTNMQSEEQSASEPDRSEPDWAI